MNVVIPTLKGPNVTLRDIIPSDRASYLANAGQAEANRGFGGPTDQIGPRSEEAADRFLTGRPGWMHWVITVNDRHIGTVSLHDFDESDQHATLALGIMSAKDMGHGYGPEAMNLVLNPRIYGAEAPPNRPASPRQKQASNPFLRKSRLPTRRHTPRKRPDRRPTGRRSNHGHTRPRVPIVKPQAPTTAELARARRKNPSTPASIE